jgi:hypothetical protein
MSIILEGPNGSGKNHALLTLRHMHRIIGGGCPPFEVGVIDMDRNCRTVIGNWADHNEPDTALCRIKTVSFADTSTQPNGKPTDPFALIEATAQAAYSQSNKAIQEASGKSSGFRQFFQVIGALRQFVADDGTNWGNVSTWGTNRVLVIDNLTGLTRAAKYCAVGSKQALSQPDYQVVMNTLESLLDTILDATHCHVVLLSHLASEKDEVQGGERFFPYTIGNKLAPNIPNKFSDVILTKGEGGAFSWSTSDSRVALSARHLPVSAKLEPKFSQLFTTPEVGWLARGGVIAASAK